MKKILIAPVLAIALLVGGASAAPAISTSGESSSPAPAQYNVYQCWTYDNFNRWWYGQHANLNTARSLAMTACRANNDQYARCWHWNRPCQIVTVY